MTGKSSAPSEPMLTIGAVSRATGIPIETLRTWERRYGSPASARRPSGHRLYPLSSVARLRRVAAALLEGHRPAQVLGLADAELDSLLIGAERRRADGAEPPRRKRRRERVAQAEGGDIGALLDAVVAFDAARLRAALESRAALQTPLGFLELTVQPLMRDIGRQWEQGTLGVRHEHFASAAVLESLAALRRRLDRAGNAPVVATALLPGDRHELGLRMAGVVFAAAGWRVLDLGPETPARQLLDLAREVPLEAVAIGRSATAPRATENELRELAAELPARTRLVLGGSGAVPGISRARRFQTLGALARWASRESTRRAQGPGRA